MLPSVFYATASLGLKCPVMPDTPPRGRGRWEEGDDPAWALYLFSRLFDNLGGEAGGRKAMTLGLVSFFSSFLQPLLIGRMVRILQ